MAKQEQDYRHILTSFLRDLKKILVLNKVISEFMGFPFTVLPKALYATLIQDCVGKQPELADQRFSCRLLHLPLGSFHSHQAILYRCSSLESEHLPALWPQKTWGKPTVPFSSH